MVCMRVAFHENNENGKDNSDSYKQGVECWISGNHTSHKMTKTTGTRGATTGSRNNGFTNARWKR